MLRDRTLHAHGSVNDLNVKGLQHYTSVASFGIALHCTTKREERYEKSKVLAGESAMRARGSVSQGVMILCVYSIVPMIMIVQVDLDLELIRRSRLRHVIICVGKSWLLSTEGVLIVWDGFQRYQMSRSTLAKLPSDEDSYSSLHHKYVPCSVGD